MATDDKGKKPEDKNAPPTAKDGDKKTDIEQLQATNQQLQQQIALQSQQMEELKGTVVSPQYQAFVESSKKQAGSYSPTEFAAGRGQEQVDLETLDRNQFAQYIAQMIDGKINTTVKPQVDKMGQDLQRDQLNRSIKDAKAAHDDFDNWRLQMTQISSRIEKGGITAEDMYKIASHPGTAKEKPKVVETEKPGASGEIPPAGKEETTRETADRIGDKLFGD